MASGDNQQPTFMSGLMAGLQNAPSNPLYNMGLGLMGAARPGGNVGQSLLEAGQATTQNQLAQQQLAINKVNAQKAQAMWPAYQAALSRIANRGQTGAPNSAPSGAPQVANGNQAPLPNQYRPPAPLAPIPGDPVGDVQQGQDMAFLGMPGADTYSNSGKNMQAAQEFQLKQRQAQTAPQMSILDTIAGAANADEIVKNDPELISRWQEVAPRMGLNPTSSLTPENARAFGRYGYNEFAGSSQLPDKPMPDIFDQIPGANGQVIQRNRTTGAITEPIPQKLPTYTLEKQWDPTSGRNVGIMVQTSPGGSPAPATALGGPPGLRSVPRPGVGASRPPAGAGPTAPAIAPPPNGTAARGGLGAQASPPIDLGYEKPTDAQLKVATLANYARSSIPTLQQLEDSGYRMSPTTRTAVIDAATNDDPKWLSQWFSQQMLAHKLGPQDQQYLAALMPFLQAAGHDMSGARLTTAALRQAFESTIPVDSKDPQYMAEIANNRKQLYSGLLAGSANAAQMPEFKNTLGADQAALSRSGQAPVKVGSPAQARSLAPGTVFITPDGRLKVR